ncbi:DUF3885 domain-containing protein [Brevundimonas sp. VNH65]|uniref:DUF3885 domain-containing protein n=1 Tax=Brevundimonas sp. VNH65 TaxID=3400917 RepID=UPI003C054199
MARFEQAWESFYPGHHPIGWMLRDEGAQHWVRFHSLPESKRYPDTDEERTVLLARQNALAAEVIGGGPCWLVQTHWTTLPGDLDWPDQHDSFWATREYGLEYVSEFIRKDDADAHEPDREPDRPWRVYSGQTDWSPGRFDHLLLSIADDEAGPTLWMGITGQIFAPYDGGVDLFLSSPAAVEAMRKQYADWLSGHPSGL